MGPRNSKDSQMTIIQDYQIIQVIPTQNISFLQHKISEEEFLLKQFNFNDKKQCEKTMERLAELKTKLAGNKHVVPLKDYRMSAEDQYCSTFYKIYALFEYPQRTLDDQINQRKLHRKKFTQTQLWSILASCIVGLSHLQKNGIKHSALKSKNILLSRQGIIKISDPLSIGHQPNYDTALTKRSTQHIYLSPQQTQALQQETVSPVFNSFKSDIWTLGMIMLQAGLLEYQDTECYRDDKSRIHWETVQYNIQRLGQAYSDQIKNMVQFMLSRDQRARPDWIDLEEHVMKGGDEVRRSFIQQQHKAQKTQSANLPNSQDTPTNNPNNTSHIPLNPNKLRSTASQPYSTNSNSSVPPLRLSPNMVSTTTNVYNHYSPRVPSVPVPGVQMPSSYQQPTTTTNSTFGKYPRPQSPRISNSSSLYTASYGQGSSNIPSILNYNPPTMINSTLVPPPLNFHHNYPPPPQTIPVSSNYSSNYTSNFYNQQLPTSSSTPNTTTTNITPLKPSNIEQTRPMKNIFPVDTYVNKSKFDQNLIIMTQDDYQSEDNQQNGRQNSNNTYLANTGQQVQSRTVYNMPEIPLNNHTPTNLPNNNNSNQNYMRTSQPQTYPPPQPQPQPQNRQTKPFSEYTTTTQPQYTQPQQQPLPQQQAQRPNTFGTPNTTTNTTTNTNPQLKFVTQQFRMGSRYQGYKLNGLRHGYGKFYYQDGGMYDGDWRQNKMEGFGKLFYQSGKLAYEGEWKNDQFMGKGVLYNELPDILDQPFNYNNFDDVEEYWTKYQGQFADDMKNGKGVLYLSNGQKFDGNFVADSVQGPGVYYTLNGGKISGNWVGNRKA